MLKKESELKNCSHYLEKLIEFKKMIVENLYNYVKNKLPKDKKSLFIF